MFLNLAHTKLNVFITGKNLVLTCYKISRGSLIEVDTIFGLAVALEYLKKEELDETGLIVVKLFKCLAK